MHRLNQSTGGFMSFGLNVNLSHLWQLQRFRLSFLAKPSQKNGLKRQIKRLDSLLAAERVFQQSCHTSALLKFSSPDMIS